MKRKLKEKQCDEKSQPSEYSSSPLKLFNMIKAEKSIKPADVTFFITCPRCHLQLKIGICIGYMNIEYIYKGEYINVINKTVHQNACTGSQWHLPYIILKEKHAIIPLYIKYIYI